LGAFGEKLRKQREQRGIALDAISNTTKISTRMLRALEEEHFDQLPGGVFNKGFVRAYARQVGLNEEEAVSDYLAALRESQIQQQSILPDFRDLHHTDLRSNDLRGNDLRSTDLRSDNLRNDGQPGNDPHSPDLRRSVPPGSEAVNDGNQLRREDRRQHGRRSQDVQGDTHSSASPDSITHPPAERFRQKYPAGSPPQPSDAASTTIPWGKLAGALLLVTFALALWNSRRHGESAASSPAASSNQSPAPVATLTPASTPTQPPSSASSVKVSPAAAAAQPTKALSSGTLPPATISAGSQPPATISAAASPQSSLTASSTAAATPRAAKTPTPVAAKRPVTFTLLIRAEKTTWISITADGKPVAEETLIAPAATSVRATGEIVVRAGNAAGVSFQLNGKEIPVLGNEGEVKTYIFDSTGIRAAPQPQAPATNQ
jgi:cytoskeletal protein RodZ